MTLSTEAKQLLAELLPAVQAAVDTAVRAIPGVGQVAGLAVDAGVAAIEAHNQKYFTLAPGALVPGIAPVVPTAAPGATASQAAVALAMGNAPLAPQVPQVAATPDDESVLSLTSLYNLIVGLAAKVEAISAAAGLQTSAAMAAHAPSPAIVAAATLQ